MDHCLGCLGLGFLTETEEEVRSLWGYMAKHGTAVTGYYGSPYVNQHFGDAQLILRTIRQEQCLEVVGMDTHAAGSCVWEGRISGMRIARRDADRMERRCVIHRESDGGGLAVVNIVNADVLPSFMAGEKIRLQMIAFPTFLEYFGDEEAYIAAQTEDSDGEKWILSEGAMLPAGLMRNRNPNSDDFETDEDLDDLMWIRGTVKALYHGVFELEGEKRNTYMRCIIETAYGDLEIAHTLDDVQKEQRKNIRIGATVAGVFTLSGDAAIYEYEHGFVLNEQNNLTILRDTFAGEDPERIRWVLAENASYHAEYNSMTYTGRAAIINRLKDVIETSGVQRFAYLATIISVDEGAERLPYAAGRRCIVIAAEEEHRYESIAFVDLDENGCISRLVTTQNGRYHFRLDGEVAAKDSRDAREHLAENG